MGRIYATIILISIVQITVIAQARNDFQTSFTAESKIRRSVKIPDAVLKQISREYEEMPGKDAFMSDLDGAFVYLNSDKQPELVIQGPSGANITTFRIYRKFRNGKWQEILKEGDHDLLIETATSYGFRNISTAGMTAVTLFESQYIFNGHRYVPVRCSEQQMGVRKARKRFVRCDQD